MKCWRALQQFQQEVLRCGWQIRIYRAVGEVDLPTANWFNDRLKLRVFCEQKGLSVG